MRLNKNSFFWYIFLITSIIVITYFFIFSGRINHHKFVFNQLKGDVIIKSFKDYDALKSNIDFYQRLYGSSFVRFNEFHDHAIGLFAKIVRFSQTNKNYKYKYRDYKKLNNKDFQELEKILNNVSLEGAYFLAPQHLDKVTINLFTSDLEQKKIFLEYLKFIISLETKKYFKNLVSIKWKSADENEYVNTISKMNLVRDLNYKFIIFLDNEIFNNDQIDNELINKIYTEVDIKMLLDVLKCQFLKIDYSLLNCAIIEDEHIDQIVYLYNSLNSLQTKNFSKELKLIGNYQSYVDGSHKNLDFISSHDSYLLEYLHERWFFFSGYNQIISYVSIENFLSKNKLDELKNLSLIVDANNKIKKIQL